MTGEIGLLTVRNSTGMFEYRIADRRHTLNAPEATLDQYLSGPPLLRRMVQHLAHNNCQDTILRMLGKNIQDMQLIDINMAAGKGNELAVKLICGAGREMGNALVPFISYWKQKRKMDFIDVIVIGSGVAKLGDGLVRDGRGLLISAIRESIKAGLLNRGIGDYNTEWVVLSKIGYERELYAFG